MSDSGIPLQTFVADTIKAIVAGVSSAMEPVSTNGGVVNPATNSSTGWPGPWSRSKGVGVQFVEFDVAVTSSEATDTKGGVGAMLGPIVLGSVGKSSDQQQHVSRIRFNVPLILPPGEREC